MEKIRYIVESVCVFFIGILLCFILILFMVYDYFFGKPYVVPPPKDTFRAKMGEEISTARERSSFIFNMPKDPLNDLVISDKPLFVDILDDNEQTLYKGVSRYLFCDIADSRIAHIVIAPHLEALSPEEAKVDAVNIVSKLIEKGWNLRSKVDKYDINLTKMEKGDHLIEVEVKSLPERDKSSIAVHFFREGLMRELYKSASKKRTVKKQI